MHSRASYFIALVSVVTAACAPEDQPGLKESNVALVKQFYDEFDTELSLEVLDRWLTPEYVLHRVGVPEPIDRAGYLEGFPSLFNGFAEIKHEIVETVVQGDRVGLYVDISMIHTGPYAGIEPTGRTIHVSEMVILRWEDGKIAEEWLVFDSASFMQQLQAQDDQR